MSLPVSHSACRVVRLPRLAKKCEQPADDGLRRVVSARPVAALLVRSGLWALVGLGAVGGVLGFLGLLSDPSPDLAVTTDLEAPPEVLGFAAFIVGNWIEAEVGSGQLEGLFLEPPVDEGEPGLRAATRVTAVAARARGPGYWAVSVAVDLQERSGKDPWAAAGTWFVEVGVTRSPAGTLAAASTPGLVSAPVANADEQRPAGGLWSVPTRDDQLTSTIGGFAGAFLAGGGDLSRYLAPGVELAPVTPAPMRSVLVHRLATSSHRPGRARARVLLEGTTLVGNRVLLAYELDLLERAGRWEVASVTGAPTLTDVRRPKAAASTTSGSTPGGVTGEPADTRESSTPTSAPVASAPGA